jgi:hypothetical protein
VSPGRLLWGLLVPLLLANAVMWQWYTHQTVVAVGWLGLALVARWAFAADDYHSAPRRRPTPARRR